MKQAVGPKKIRQYRAATGLDVEMATVRGGSHTVTLYLFNLDVWYWNPATGEREKADHQWVRR